MFHSRNLRSSRLLGALVAAALFLSACAAPATTPPAAEAPAAAGLPAQPGRGTDGTLTLVYWQEVSNLNSYLSQGTKDNHAASLIVEPLIEFAPDGSLVPVLASEVPTLENGGIAPDLVSVTYKLRPGVLWSDGTPFTADDVVFTWQYCVNPETGCSSAGSFAGVENVEAVDPLTVRITFQSPKPYPYMAFAGQIAPIIQKAQNEACVGAAAQGCSEQNSAPIGTGPYKVKEFRANDTVIYAINENYRVADQPHFSEVIIKGAEDASASARAVLETGEADYAWNLQVEPAILNEMAVKGNGELLRAFAGNVERILFNHTNPAADLGENRSNWSADAPNPHPFLNDKSVRQALSMAIDRNFIAEQLYGAGGRPTCNILSGPPAAVSTANDACLTQDLEGARALLEGAGWIDSDGDGIREKDGLELRLLYQTGTNSVRQKVQALVQQWWKEIGVEAELRSIEGAVFFSSDPASTDTFGKFYADVEMFTTPAGNPDPEELLNDYLCYLPDGSVNIASLANQHLGANVERWCNPAYDALFATLGGSVGEERFTIAKQLNDMIAADFVNAPLVYRAQVSARTNSLLGVQMNGWDSEEWNIETWYRAR